MAALQKTYQCLTCHQDIRLERKPDDSGWLRYNLDGTPHIDSKKNFPPKTAEKVEQLERKIDTLIAQIQMLRSEFKELKEAKK